MKLLLASFLLTATPSFALASSSWAPARDCRNNIRRVTCRVTPLSPKQEKDPVFQRQCLGGEEPYILELEKVHDELPPKLRKMFCHLRRIYVEEDFYATAYASRYREVSRGKNGNYRVSFNGNVLGLSRKKVFESKYGLSEWLNRKEQTLFGRKMDDPLLPDKIPTFHMSYGSLQASPLLMHVVLHEFGHMLSLAHQFNSHETPSDLKCTEEANTELTECRPQLTGLWASVSWMPDGSIRNEDRYYGEYRACYYNCESDKLLPLEKAAETYRNFVNSSAFVSLYASVNSVEDFAESFHYYISIKYFSNEREPSKFFDFSLTFPNEAPVQLNGWNRGRIQAKMDFMSMFDSMPWKYEPKSNFSMSWETYLNDLVPTKNPL